MEALSHTFCQAVSRDTQFQLEKASLSERVKYATDVTRSNIEALIANVGDMSGKERASVLATLEGWKKLGAQSPNFVDALKRIAEAFGTVSDAADSAGKTYKKTLEEFTPEKLGKLSSELANIGKTEMSGDASEKAAKPYLDYSVSTSDKKKKLVDDFDKLSKEEQARQKAVQDALLGTLDELITGASLKGAAAGQKAATDFLRALEQGLAAGRTGLAQVNLEASRPQGPAKNFGGMQSGLKTSLFGENSSQKTALEAAQAAEIKLAQARVETTRADTRAAEAALKSAAAGKDTEEAQTKLNTALVAQSAATNDLTQKEKALQATRDSGKGAVQIGFEGGFGKASSEITSVATAFGGLLNPMTTFADIIAKFNPVGAVMAGIFEVLDPIITALQDPLKDMGVVIGSLLAPALELLAPIVKGVADIFIAAYDAIALFIKTITFGLVNIDRRTTDRQTSSANKTSSEANTEEGKQLKRDFEAGKISHMDYQYGLLQLTQKRLGEEGAIEARKMRDSSEYRLAAGEKRLQMENALQARYDASRADAQKGYYDALAQHAGEITKSQLENETTLNEQNYKKGLIGFAAYEAEKLRIAQAQLEIQRATDIAAAGGDADKIAVINAKYDALKITSADEINTAIATHASEIHKGQLENETLANERAFKQRLISKEQYEAEKLRITLATLELERQAAITAAAGDAEKIANINESCRQKGLDANQAYLDAINQQWIDLASSIEKSITQAITDGFKNATKKGDFSSFKDDIQKEIGKILFDATLQAIVQTVALDAFITPAINTFKNALKGGNQSEIDAAFQGVLDAGKNATNALDKYVPQIMRMREYSGVGDAEDAGKVLKPTDGKTGGIYARAPDPNAEQVKADNGKTKEQLIAELEAARAQNVKLQKPIGPTPNPTPIVKPSEPPALQMSSSSTPLTIQTIGNAPLNVKVVDTPPMTLSPRAREDKAPQPAGPSPESLMGAHIDRFGTHVDRFGGYVDRLSGAAKPSGRGNFTTASNRG